MTALHMLMKTLSSLKIESIDRAYIGLIGGLIGSLSTFFLSGWRQWRIEKRQAYAAQLMLSIEIEQNLELLKDYWEIVNHNKSIGNESKLSIYRLDSLIQLPMPEFSSHAWSSQILVFGSTIKENKIKQIQYFYNYLNTIQIIYSRMVDSGKEDWKIASAERKDNLAQGMPGFFSVPGVSISSWKEFEKLICKVIENGNPLQK